MGYRISCTEGGFLVPARLQQTETKTHPKTRFLVAAIAVLAAIVGGSTACRVPHLRACNPSSASQSNRN